LGELRLMREGEWFGEIGVLRRIARTATVTAVGEVELLSIRGSTFTAAVSGESQLSDPFRRSLSARLFITHPQLVDAEPLQ